MSSGCAYLLWDTLDRAGCGIWLYQFLIIAHLFTLVCKLLLLLYWNSETWNLICAVLMIILLYACSIGLTCHLAFGFKQCVYFTYLWLHIILFELYIGEAMKNTMLALADVAFDNRQEKCQSDAFAITLTGSTSAVLALSSVYHATMTILKLIRTTTCVLFLCASH